MNLTGTKRTNHALTLTEVLVIIAVLVFLCVFMDFGVPTSAKHKAQQISCLNNLKQIGLAYRTWASDHQDKYPMEISITNGGTKELVNSSDAWKTFLVMSNELSSPRVLFCPSDLQRTYIHDFGPGFSAQNICYFIGADVTVTNGNALLSGDDNLIIDASPVKSGIFEVKRGTSIRWDSTRHISVKSHTWFEKYDPNLGNIGLGDGSVQSTLNSSLTNYLSQTGLATNRLVIP
jgi:hypothetical protein